jgi:cell division protein FtsB|tara:strand:+ start:674 stop:880 length:207 start_codon:yes stop_codon:yes gene_type:complete
MNAQIVINTLQKKISELTLVNVMLEAQIADLQNQLNSMNQDQLSENAIDGNENQTKEIDSSSDGPDNF